jgi:protein arginine kinase activator
MKKCHRCTKPATLHITEIRENQVQALHLCEKCAQEYLTSVEVGSAADEPGQSATTPAGLLAQEVDEHIENLTCPNCGITYKEFRSQGRLGCPNDYIAFHDELLPLLESIHGETQHVGKIPKHAPDLSQRQYELIRLRNSLRSAVDSEQYEEAASLRDQIRQLEEELE